jgi:hypothetical protein
MTQDSPNQPTHPPQGYAAPHQGQLKNGMGTAALVLGILGIVLFFFPYISVILALLGVIFGGIGIQRANRGEANNKGMAIAGLVCGIVGLVISIILLIAIGSIIANSN